MGCLLEPYDWEWALLIIGERSEAVGCVVEPMDFMLSGLYRILLKSVFLMQRCLLLHCLLASELLCSFSFSLDHLPCSPGSNQIEASFGENDPSHPS